MRDTERDRQRHRQREKQAPCREPDARLDPGIPGSRPGQKAGAKPLSHLRIPNKGIFKKQKPTRTRVGKLQPLGQIQPAVCFGK